MAGAPVPWLAQRWVERVPVKRGPYKKREISE